MLGGFSNPLDSIKISKIDVFVDTKCNFPHSEQLFTICEIAFRIYETSVLELPRPPRRHQIFPKSTQGPFQGPPRPPRRLKDGQSRCCILFERFVDVKRLFLKFGATPIEDIGLHVPKRDHLGPQNSYVS